LAFKGFLSTIPQVSVGKMCKVLLKWRENILPNPGIMKLRTQQMIAIGIGSAGTT
jgi:hypothetical protein